MVLTRDAFPQAVGKFVRPGHIHTHGGFMREQMTLNKLASHA